MSQTPQENRRTFKFKRFTAIFFRRDVIKEIDIISKNIITVFISVILVLMDLQITKSSIWHRASPFDDKV